MCTNNKIGAITTRLVVAGVFCFVYFAGNAQVSTNKNFVATMEVKQPGVQTISSVNSLPAEGKVTKVEYIDGLGRNAQTVLLNAKESGVDIIIPKSYDLLGRVDKEYLPYAMPAGTGAFRPNWQSEQLSFYQNNAPATLPNDLPDNNPFSINVYEPSPLNRVIQNFSPGNPWAGTIGTGSSEVSVKNEIKIYDPSTGDNVKSWDLVTIPVISSSYTYQLGDLVKTRVFDEHGKMVDEYKDKSGNTILKKVQLDNTPGVGDPHNGWLCTYYVYDDLGRLRYVLPPKAVEYLQNNGWVLAQSIIDELCFWYEYDDRGRLITKHVPGAAPVNMVYDKRDRLILTQDGNMASQQKWLLTLYDHLNRPLATALWPSRDNRAAIQAQADQSYILGNTTESILGDNLTVSYRPSFINTVDVDFLTVNYYDVYPASINYAGNSTFYTGFTLPYTPGQITATGDYPLDAVKNPTINGKLLATKAKILDASSTVGGNSYLFTANYYDKEYRIIQTIKQNLMGVPYVFDYVIGVVTNQYDFTGKILGSQEVIDPYGAPLSIVTKNVLDIEGKVTQVYKGANSTSATKLIVTNEYDILGRLKIKTTGAGTICESKQDYTYNIRGWIRGMNMNYLNDNILLNNQRYFGYELGYNTLTSGGSLPNPQLNGNIGSMVWASAGKAGRDAQGIWLPLPSGAGVKRKYDYTYDNTNRLKKADFTELKSIWNNSEKDFSVSGADPNGMIGYDANGNILSMKQMGLKGTTIQLIDNLNYHYNNNDYSNRLLWVNDAANDELSDLGDFKENKLFGNGTQDYYYDDNGNLTKDKNKDISTYGFNPNAPAIEYTYMNQPSSISVLNTANTTQKGGIKFTYDAFGNKLRKVVTDFTTTPNQTITVTNYVNGIIYGGGFGTTVDQIATEEGRIRYAMQPNNTYEYKYDWMIKDHLGNIRMVLTEEPTPSPMKPYKATFEDVPTQKVTKEDIAMEKELFGEDVLQPTRSPLPVELRDKDPGNKKCSLLKPGSSNNGKVPYKILKVNPGDKFNIGVQYYYRPDGNKTDGKNLREDILKNLISGILGGGGTVSGVDKVGGARQQNLITSPYSNSNALGRFTQDDNDRENSGRRPRAYLNYVLMDTAMQFIKGGALRVGEMDAKEPEWKNLVQNDIEATQLGYFLVYISNEEQPSSNLGAGNVYFDNLVIITNEGPVMEEDHYYPFGLLIHPISTTGSGRLKNNYKFQGQELNDNFDVYYYEFRYRQHDPQIGRFTQIDPLSDKFVYNSIYAFSENHVTNSIELEGLEEIDVNTLSYLNNLLFDYNGVKNSLPSGQTMLSLADFAKSYSLPKANLSGQSLFDKDVRADFIVENHHSSQLQIAQTVSTTSFNQAWMNKLVPQGNLDKDNFLKGTYRFNSGGDQYQGFVDGGVNSGQVLINSQPPVSYSAPYYFDLDQTKTNGKTFFPDAAGVQFYDEPWGAAFSSKVNFTTYLIGVNYLNTGRDRILGSFSWGFTNNGGTPTFSGVNFKPGFAITPIDLNIIKHDYPSYSFFGY